MDYYEFIKWVCVLDVDTYLKYTYIFKHILTN
jgi:hypothetical protein